MPRSEQLLVVPSAYRVANQQRMAARRALEWIGASKPGWFLDMKYHTCSSKEDLLLTAVPTFRQEIKTVCKLEISTSKVKN